MIGFHLIIDGVLVRRIGRREVTRMLSELPAEIDMRVIAGPLVVEGSPDNPGWTGIAVIEKSHIAIHTFEEGDRASVDVFSCKPFEEEAVLRYLGEHIPFRKMNTRMLTRTDE